MKRRLGTRGPAKYSLGMPFKSEAQRRKLHALAAEGKISKETVDEWEAATKAHGKPLPEYSRKPQAKKVRAVKKI